MTCIVMECSLCPHALFSQAWSQLCINPFVFSTACRGVDDTANGRNVLPGSVSNFRDCVIVNGDLIFNFNTFDEFRYE